MPAFSLYNFILNTCYIVFVCLNKKNIKNTLLVLNTQTNMKYIKVFGFVVWMCVPR